MKEINVNNMVQGIKQNMSTIRYIRILFIMLALFMGTASEAWAYTKLDPVNGVTVYLERTPSNTGGTIAVSDVSAVTGGKKVTLTITPSTGYSISENLITAVPVKNISTTRTGTPDLMEDVLPITDEGDNKYHFILPSAYTAAYVTVTFHAGDIGSIVFIRSLNEISTKGDPTDPTEVYQLATDINASGWTSIAEFKGTLDGNFHKITNLSTPLFTKINGGTVKNVIFEGVNISSGDDDGDAGAICCKAEGASRIYNCGILPTGVLKEDPNDENKITGFSGSSVGGGSTGNVGGLVGTLSGTSRVVNCYSYATITSGNIVAGIVGNNTGTSNQSGVTTMVMNCMFYGDIASGVTTASPVFGGNNIDNRKSEGTPEKPHGLATYNYYAYSQLKSKPISATDANDNNYHCTLGVEDRFLVRAELYRQLLNSNKRLAAIYATGSASDAETKMAKWVLETADRTISNPMPYPVLKAQGYYPSIINPDFDNAPDGSSVGRNHGGKLGKTLTVHIGGVGSNAPSGASIIRRGAIHLERTDKDFDRYNFNYDKVQLPYYNEVGTGNYTKASDGKSRVVTGWKIVSINGGTPGAFTEADEYGGYNFADRNCTNKDLYGTGGSNRVFSQGAYFDVPYGVTNITIEPYWGEAAYVSDKYYDVVYKQVSTVINNYNNYSAQDVTGLGTQYNFGTGTSASIDIFGNGETQTVYSTIEAARSSMNIPTSGKTVYDYAVVLVGNVHQAGPLYGSGNTPYSIMSVDLDKDHEPDYSFIFSHYNRKPVSSIRFDFLNVIGTAEAQKPNGADQLLNVSIFNPLGWFEVTNTCTIHITQFEADNSKESNSTKNAAPVILLGGVIDQYTSTKDTEVDKNNTTKTIYIHLGSNACFKEFGNGTHSDGWNFTRHVPVSVTGGDFEGFYLSGVYRSDAQVKPDNAEGYISGGRFTEMAGAAQQMIEGNVHWQIYDADITNFYGGGINADRPVTGDVTVDIFNSHVGTFCGGPKFGDMQEADTELNIICSKNKAGTDTEPHNIGITKDGIVTTNATGCTFETFFGAGYGGASSFKLKYFDSTSPNFTTLINKYNSDRGLYFDGNDNKYKTDYGNKGPGVATEFDYEFFVWSSGAVGARFYVNYTTFSLAKTRDVTSNLERCTITGNFYGGGSCGKVEGTATSELKDCTVKGNVYAAGYSASKEDIPVPVRNTGFEKTPSINKYAGIFDMGKKNGTLDYIWKEGTLTKNTTALNGSNIITNLDLGSLGQVDNSKLTILGTTTVKGSVYGGGQSSDTMYDAEVNVLGGTMEKDVYGGGEGNTTIVGGDVKVYIGKLKKNTTNEYEGDAKVKGSVYGGSALGAVNATKTTVNNATTYSWTNDKNTFVNVYQGTVNGSVFGGGLGQKTGVDSGSGVATSDIVAKVFGDATVTIGAAKTSGDSWVEAASPTVKGSVFGGSNVNGVSEQDVFVNVISGTIGNTTASQTSVQSERDVHGGGLGQPTLVKGDVTVNIGAKTDETTPKYYGFATIHGNVYGGSAKGNVNAYIDTDDEDKLKQNGSAKTDVNLYGGDIKGSLYGGGLGYLHSSSETESDDVAANVYGPVTVTVEGGTAGKVFGCNDQNGAPQSTVAVLITNTAAPTPEIPNPIGSVYGGGNLADYTGSPTVRMDNGTVGYLYGGGLGSSAIITGNTSVTLTNGTVKNDVYGGGNEADVTGSVTVNMTAGTVDKDVYGGGALANTNTNIANDATIKTTVNLLGGTIVGDAYGGGLGRQADNNVTPAVTAVEAKVYGDVKIYLNGMDKSFYVAADATMKTVFDTRITKPEGASYYLVKTTGTKGAVVKRVFGANNKNGSPQKNVTVHVFGTQHKDAEDIRTKLKNANADLEKGSSQTDEEYISVLKGVLTDMITKAGILHIAVTNNEGTGYQDICNNTTSTADALKKAINDINDEINAKILDENTSADDIDALFARIYDVEAVYGGGNEAAYIPTTAWNGSTGSKTQVIIEGCDETSIEAVYGGGNAASAPETNVDIVSAHEIQTVFGGGNGKDNKSDGSANPGADVGVYKVGTTETIYGTGNATTLLEGGYFHEAYGASNSKGNIKGNISINTNPAGSCNLKYDKLVGAGKNADVDKDVIMILGCNPRTKNPLIFGGADNANVNGNVELTITSGTFGKVFGGNNLGGIIKGHIKVNIEETECTPIRIDELYLGGNQAAYSIYGYYKDGDVYKPRTAAMAAITDPNAAGYQAAEEGNHTAPYDEPVLNVISCTYIGKVFGGGYGERAVLYGNPTVNINMIAGRWANELGAADKLGEIVDVFGGGNAAKVEGNTTVNIGTTQTVGMVTEPTYLGTSAYTKNTTTGLYDVKVQGANITGNVYGGGNEADITGNTQVNICAKYNSTTAKWESVSYATGLAGVTIGVDGVKDKDHGNVFGGGKGIADNFYCDKAMVGINGAGADEVNYPNGYPDGNTSVFIGNGTVNGSVYGGGEIGRVEMNTAVTIGIEGGTTTSAPRIKGNVFGAGKGLETHGYAALVRGNPIVTIQGNAKVDSCVYGGGEIASVARYQVVGGVPVALAGEEGNYSGYCTVNVLGNAIIGPDEKMVMHHVDAQGNTVNGSDGFPLLPDDAGHVFAAGKGVLPKIYTYADNDHRPKRMLAYNDETISKISSGEIAYWEYSDAPTNKNIWQFFKNETQYFEFIQTLALATQTAVTVDGNAFVKGSVYGGSQNGLVQYDTHVTIDGNCQIGCGKNTTDRHPDAVWGETYPVTEGTNLECASWEYDPLSGAPYDPYAKYLYNGKYYYDEAHTKYAEGGSIVAKDGHTYYGNVFGGGSGSVPYFDTEKGISRYIPTAGEVKRDTYVTISGGHILTNVYGGNEATNVLGTAHITMTGGTIGVPRTPQQIKDHPVTCYLFGAGKGDQRIFFNKETNVNDAIVKVEGGRIYGSVFGGGEDGHVLRNTEVTIGKADGTGPKIGTVGSTYVDGNVFGGGRGFSGEALTAGNVGGSVDLIINGGTMLGSIYGGGRLASVGYGLYLTTETGYGVMRDDKEYDGSYPNPSPDDAEIFYNKGRGHITVTVNGGTIGKEFESDVEGEHSGNVFGGSMGRLTKLDGSSFDNSHWPLLATAKSTTVNINGGTIKRSVYGGGEMGTVTTDAIVNVSGGTIGTSGKGGAEFGNVYGGGKGYVDDAGTYATAGIIKGNTKVTINSGTNGEPKIYHNIYGGGAYGSVGTITYGAATYVPNQTAAVSNMPTAWERAAEGTTQANTGTAEVYVYGGTIGTNGNENGMVFGSSRGDVGTPVNGIDPNNRLAWVYNTKVVIGGEGKSPIVYGSVYGSGENGHVFENTQVEIHSGTMGVTTDDSFGGPNYRLRGNVYGGGCGEDTYPGTTGTTKENFNPLAGIVLGTTNVMIDGGQVVHNVYGAGALGSATNTSVTIAGNAVIGVSGKNGGNVFGAARGKEGITIVGSNLANSIETAVNINGGQIWGSVYGGGETGNVKQDVNVSMTGGAVAKDVYGGGALAHTQTANWDMTNASWLTDKISTTPNGKTTTTYKTHVSLTGGTITGDAYGGALGRKAVDGIAAVGTEGQDGYTPAVPAITAVEAMVYGDVLVELNGKTTVSNGSTSTTIVGDNAKGCIVNRVFGCNNLNGTPNGKVKVYVYATQKNGESDIVTKAVKNTNTYDVQAVYGGGNLAVYEPVDATLEYNDANKARVDAAYPEVVIDGCKVTSIKQVYGGGNAASVPATFVEIRRCYEIDEVFGGGNGFDNYSVEERGQTVWHQNPGANVGYYDYTHTVTSGTKPGTATNPYYLAVEDTRYAGGADHKEARLAAKDIQYGSGIARLEVKGGTIHTSYGGSNSKGNVRAKLSSVYSAMFDDCEMQVTQSYGGGKNAYSDGDPDMVADCAKGVKEMFGGARDADMDGNINMLITNGSSLERVFGGNNTSGAVNGSITITLEEGGCEPIKIGELYAGGFLAPYSVYGYEKNEDGSYKTESVKYLDENNVEQTKLQRIPLESGTRLYNDPRINVISATSIGNIFGGGYQAKLVGNPHINVNMTTGFVKVTKTLVEGTTDQYIYKDVAGNTYAAEKVSEVSSDSSDPEAKSYIATTDLGTIGNIYGGGNMADIVGDTYVEIGTGKWVKLEKDSDGKVTEVEETLDRNGAKITGNVFGGGKGKADSFECAKAMVGVNNESDDPNNRDGGTHVIIGNGTVKGNVYGGGEIGRVERNTEVTIGLGDGVEGGAKTPVIEGNVFGAGSGLKTHGYSALVRGNSTVTVQGNAWVQKSIYGGGETATVGKYALNDAGLPTAPVRGGLCTVTVKGYAEVGPDGMQMKKAGGPDDTGYVFGACKGILPYEGYEDSEKPQHMDGDRQSDGTWIDHPKAYKAFNELTLDNNNVLEVDNAYMTFINTLALATTTEVTIGGHAFIKGSVYGGSENGHVQGNTHVTIVGDCQIGNGDGVNRRYTADEWAYDGSSDAKSLKECASWDYGKKIGTDANGKDIMEYQPYDVYKDSDSDGTPDYASDGHTFYGNVFGGGSGYFSYHRNHPTALTALKAKDAGYADGLWHREAGSVGGNTVVDIKGGHILTSVYGGNECTDVTGTTTIKMSGGTLGVPRTVAQIQAHPVTCYLFGAGKGDQRINFNTWTNVEKAIVNITGGHIFGSVFGGGEDGHVLGDVEMKISGDNTVIGTTGTSYVDGNIFGGGRGFSGDAQTAGTVGGNIKINIENGKMLGSVYGGGRLASVGTLFTAPDDPNYGNFMEDADGKTYGHVTINIIGGIIGNGTGNSVIGDVSGNVFGGSMGRLTLLNGGTNPIWPKMAQVKSTEVNISGNALIKRTVYGGGELGTVRDNTHVTISGGQVNRDVYGGGYGSEDDDLHTIFTVKEPNGSNGYIDNTYAFTPMQFAGCVGKSTTVDVSGGYIRKSVYGGGEMASVGIMNCLVEEVTSEPGKDKIVVGKNNGKWTIYKNMRKHWDVDNEFALSWPIEFSYIPTFDGATHINITGGRIGTTTADDYGTDNGDVYGGGKGFAGDYNDYVFCANVGSTDVNINYASGATTLDPAAYMSGGDCIAGAVYGGGENGHVMGDTHVTLTNGLIGHGLYGGGSGKGTFSQKLLKIGATKGSTSEADYYTRDIYSITAGKVFGNTRVDMSGGYVVRNVYGGGTMGSVGKGNYAGGTDDYSTTGYGENAGGNLWTSSTDGDNAWQFLNSGICTVNITGGTVGYTGTKDGLPYGNVFGGCRGEAAPNIVETPRYLYSPEFFVGYANETRVTIGAEGSTTGPRIFGSVYGGGQDGHVRGDAKVTINSGEIGSTYAGNDLNAIEWKYAGNVFGAGSGIGKYLYDFDYDGKFESTVEYDNGRAKVDTKEEDYSTSAGSVTRSTIVEVKGGTIHRNVYGGGSLASVGAPKIGQGYDPYHPSDSEHSSEVGKQSLNKVTISGGTIGDVDGFANGYGGDVNGGSRGDNALGNSFSTSIWTDVTISGSADIKGNVFGGGEAGLVKQDTEVKMQGGTVGNDLYGAGDMADVNGNTTVSLTGGTIQHDAYGGARGTATIAANVGGDVLVDVNNVASNAKGCVLERVFGANNVNGTPKGHVKVHVHATQNKNTSSVSEKATGGYDVAHVFGGGNASDYVPDAADKKQSTEVIIEGCDLTSIEEVYGGGYGAAVPATDVLIKGTKIINNVFGGGYGAGTDNPGANVGYVTGGSRSPYALGTGKAVVQLMAGTVNNVYGGSNTKGDIRSGSNVTNVVNDGGPGCCPTLSVQEIYGGGSQADMFGGTEIVLGCMPNDWIGAIYAGAENANVGNDVSLTLTSGKFGRVFGGNKSGGTIDGYIEVNIEENPECSTPIIIGGLYGGGNEAPYTVPARYFTNNPNYQSPRVNVRAFTSIGNIYGGGFGASATVTGNPLVNINEVQGGREYAGEDKPLEDGTTVKLYARKADGKMGVIGNVFGGGNAAKVIGNTNVMIGTEAEQEMESLKTTDATTGTVTVVKKPVLGADIQGNVYGAGNNAEVTGHTNVVIGKKAE